MLQFISCVILLSAPCLFAESTWDLFWKTRVIHRADWGAKSIRESLATREEGKSKIALHHTAGAAACGSAVVLQIQDYHMHDRGYADIGYHFLIDQNGNIYEGRELCYKGAHVEKSNTGCVGICCIGCFDDKECHRLTAVITEKLIESLVELVAQVAFYYKIDLLAESNFLPHRDFPYAHTVCPGNQLCEHMPMIRKQVLERVIQISNLQAR